MFPSIHVSPQDSFSIRELASLWRVPSRDVVRLIDGRPEIFKRQRSLTERGYKWVQQSRVPVTLAVELYEAHFGDSADPRKLTPFEFEKLLLLILRNRTETWRDLFLDGDYRARAWLSRLVEGEHRTNGEWTRDRILRAYGQCRDGKNLR